MLSQRPLDPSGSYLINPVTGDSIQAIRDRDGKLIETMKAVPARGWKDPLMEKPSRQVSARWVPVADHAISNIKAITPKVIAQSLVFEPLPPSRDSTYVLKSSLGDTIPTGVPLVLEGKKTPVKYPQPEKSLPPVWYYDTGLNLKGIKEEQGGLPGTVSGIIEDQYGYKWASYLGSGLSRFDGQSSWHFTQKEGLPNKLVWGLIKAQDGRIWMNTLDDGVIVFDGVSFTNYAAQEGFPGNGVKGFYEDSQGNIWIRRRYGASKYDGKTFTHYSTREGLVENRSFQIFEDKAGEIWITGYGKISKFNGKTFSNFTLSHPTDGGYLTPLFEDKGGNLWLTSNSAILRYDGNSLLSIPASIRELSVCWYEDTSLGHIWITSEKKHLYKYDGLRFWDYTLLNEGENWPIANLEKDKADNLWVATAGNEFYILRENAITNLSGINGGAVAGEGKVCWFNNARGELMKYEQGRLWRLEGSGPQVNVGVVRKDSHNNLWMGMYRGVGKFDGNTLTYYRTKTTRDISVGRDFWEDRDGNIWIAKNYGVILKYDGKQYVRYDERDGLPPYHFSNILEDSKHNLWFSSDHGLVKFDGNAFTIFSEKEGLSSNHIVSMAEDKDGNLWFGSFETGLMRFDGEHFTYFTEENGLCLNAVLSIATDNKGRIWVGTGNGLNVFVPNKNISNSTAPQETTRYIPNPYNIYAYSKKDGMEGNGIGWNNIRIDEHGTLWAGTTKGVLEIDINQFSPPEGAIPVRMERIAINGQYIDFRTEQEHLPAGVEYDEVVPFFNFPLNPVLSHDHNHLTFHFSAIDWDAPHKIQYSYRLKGSRDTWSPPSSETKADFRNLSFGRHTFEVKAMGASQIWSEPFTYSFRILAPWWLTWWAVVLYGLIVLAMIFGYNQWRTRKLKARNIELEAQVEKRTVEIKEKNVQLAESLDHLKQTQQQLILQEKMASLGQMTAGIAHEIKNPLNFVNNFAEGVDEIITDFEEDLSQYQESQDPEDFQLLVDNLKDIRKYNQDILDHGKRADQIVNSMMNHANDQQGEKVPSDLNQVISTNLTLAQHGYLPQQEDFQVEISRDLDPAIPEITLNPQELGRVLINLVNNACYALEEKKASLGEGFQPTIHVSSKLIDGIVEIRVRDNGPGIPEEIREQIFQPFFTTKPTGQGNTGLGLSISYDIVRQGLRGQMAVESQAGEFTEFILSFPIQ